MNRWLNLGCGPFRAPEPWWNVDVISTNDIRPDEVVSIYEPLRDVAQASLEMVYCGHMLEHINWSYVADYVRWIYIALQDNGELCVVCPDTTRAIEGYRAGFIDFQTLLGALESEEPATPAGARHQWNATEARVYKLLSTACDWSSVVPLPIERVPDTWPVTSRAAWQCAVICRK